MVSLDDDVDVDVEDDLDRDNVAHQPNLRIAMAIGHWPSSPQTFMIIMIFA